MQNLIHKGLMAIAMAKHNYIIQNEKWVHKSMEEGMNMALSVKVYGLKGECKLARMWQTKQRMAARKVKRKRSKRKMENAEQEVYKTQKNIPPNSKVLQEKVVNKITYHWCIHHMA